MRFRSHPRRGSAAGAIVDLGACLVLLLPIAIILHLYSGWRTKALRAANPDAYCVVQNSTEFKPVSPVFRTLQETEDWAVNNGFCCAYVLTTWAPCDFNLNTQWPDQYKTLLIKGIEGQPADRLLTQVVYHIVGDRGEGKWVSLALENGEGKSGINYSRFRRVRTYRPASYDLSRHPIADQVEIPKKEWEPIQ